MSDTAYCPACERIETFDVLRSSPINLAQSGDRDDRVTTARYFGGRPVYAVFACGRRTHLVSGRWRAS